MKNINSFYLSILGGRFIICIYAMLWLRPLNPILVLNHFITIINCWQITLIRNMFSKENTNKSGPKIGLLFLKDRKIRINIMALFPIVNN